MNWARLSHNIHAEVAKGDRSVLDVFLRATDVQPLVRIMLFENAWVTHVRNKKRHTLRPFHRAMQEKRYNLNPVVVCGINVDRMIQAKLVSICLLSFCA